MSTFFFHALIPPRKCFVILFALTAGCGNNAYRPPFYATVVDADGGNPVCNFSVTCKTSEQGTIWKNLPCPSSDGGDPCRYCADFIYCTPAVTPCGTLTVDFQAPGYEPLSYDAGYFDCKNRIHTLVKTTIQLNRTKP